MELDRRRTGVVGLVGPRLYSLSLRHAVKYATLCHAFSNNGCLRDCLRPYLVAIRANSNDTNTDNNPGKILLNLDLISRKKMI